MYANCIFPRVLAQKVFALYAAAAVCLSAAPTSADIPDLKVWTTVETRRILRDAAPESTLPVELSAARNEWESFQILLRSDKPVRIVSLATADLLGPDGGVLAAKDARLFRQHQLHIQQATVRNGHFKPGWYPDALIPFRHPLSGEKLPPARFQATPFDLPADETHGFWVDIHVPENAKPGDYRGEYRLVAEGGASLTIPVSLRIWNFALPKTPTLQTALGSPAERMRSYYAQRAKNGKEKQPQDWAAIDRQCAELLHRHRINATPPPGSMTPEKQADGSFEIPEQQIDAFREFVDSYHINAYNTVHPRSAVKDPETESQTLRAWLTAWDRAAEKLDRPSVILFTYLLDEPNDKEAYRYVQKWGRAIRREKSALKVMVVEQTTPSKEKEWGNLYGAVDIWCPLFSLFQPESAAKRQALGETIWTYTALCQLEKTPWWHTDYPLLHYRVPSWIAWRYRIRGLLYWGDIVWWEHVEDPWTEPDTYDLGDKDKPPLFNGEGSLLYPARAVGYEGVAPSLRLKALRDSIEDYEYLSILERAGLAAQAEKVIMPIAGSWYKWDENPADYEKARGQLAELILGAKPKE